MNIRFLSADTHVISVGGNDACAFQWRHVNQDGSTVRTTIKLAQGGADGSYDEANGYEVSGGSGRVNSRGRVRHGHGFY